MNESAEQNRSVVIEKTVPHPVDKVWRALTESTLLAEWLLPNDFTPELGRQFKFRNDPIGTWNGEIQCKVLLLDAPRQVAYSWHAFGHDSKVHFTLTPVEGGTHVLMEHSGFRADQDAAYKGAHYGWQRFLGRLEETLGKDRP